MNTFTDKYRFGYLNEDTPIDMGGKYCVFKTTVNGGRGYYYGRTTVEDFWVNGGPPYDDDLEKIVNQLGGTCRSFIISTHNDFNEAGASIEYHHNMDRDLGCRDCWSLLLSL